MAVSVIDASALTDAFVQGTSQSATRLLLAFASERSLDFMAPDLIFPETANALRKAVLRGGVDPGEVDRAVDRLYRLPLISVSMRRLLPRAWSLRGTMTIQDAMYAALADDSKVPLITSDARLAKAASAERILVLPLGSEPLDVFLSAHGV